MSTILAVLGHLLALFGALLGPPKRPWGALGRSQDASGAPRERSWEASRRSWGALGATHWLRTPPGTDFGTILKGFWINLETDLGRLADHTQ